MAVPFHYVSVMNLLQRRKAPISVRWNASDEQLLMEAAEAAGVSRHRLIRVASVSLAKTLLAVSPASTSI
jgi:hypothetical protein